MPRLPTGKFRSGSSPAGGTRGSPLLRHELPAEGIRQSLAWFSADPSWKQIDHQVNADTDKLISAYAKGMSAAVRSFA